jgi:uncharacterized protein
MNRIFVALFCGILFGVGLTFAQMTNPEKVLNFLDIAGNWDPSLIFVMLGALLITVVSFRFILKRPAPLLDEKFYLASKSAIDKPLLAGAALFGIGWGLGGYCPGPIVAGLGLGNTESFILLAALYAGFMVHRWLFK